MSLSKQYPRRQAVTIFYDKNADYPEWFTRVYIEELAELKPGETDKTKYGAGAWVCSFCERTHRFTYAERQPGHAWINISKIWQHFSKHHPEVLTVLRLKISVEKS